jgi:hypothetical protein
MNMRGFVFVAVALAVVVTAAATAAPVAKKQRVALTTQAQTTTETSAATLTPLQGGALGPDTGSVSGSIPSEQKVMRDGQAGSVYDGVTRFVGKKGTLVIRYHQEHFDGGNGYHPGVGTWKVVRGTRAYAGVTGGGRGAHVWLDSGPWSSRLEGFLTVP